MIVSGIELDNSVNAKYSIKNENQGNISTPG